MAFLTIGFFGFYLMSLYKAMLGASLGKIQIKQGKYIPIFISILQYLLTYDQTYHVLKYIIAIEKYSEPISQLEEILQRNDLQLLITANTSFQTFFELSNENSKLKQIWNQKLKPYPENLLSHNRLSE